MSVPKELKKIMAKVKEGVKAKDPAKNPNLKIDGVTVRMMADEAMSDGAHDSHYLVRGEE